MSSQGKKGEQYNEHAQALIRARAETKQAGLAIRALAFRPSTRAETVEAWARYAAAVTGEKVAQAEASRCWRENWGDAQFVVVDEMDTNAEKENA